VGEREQEFLNLYHEEGNKNIQITFEEQEQYFLEYFMSLTPSERLRSLAELQKKNYRDLNKSSLIKITIQKHFTNGY